MWMIIGVVLLGFLVLELGVRGAYFARTKTFPLLAPLRWGGYKVLKPHLYDEHPNLGFRKKFNLETDVLPTNNAGLAGRADVAIEKGDRCRIYICGDSTAEQNDLDRKEPFNPELTWPWQMEQLLNAKFSALSGAARVEVLNSASAGYTSIEMMIDLQVRGLHYSPDLVLFYPGINDIYSAQLVAGFVPDYTHSRVPVRLPRKSRWPVFRVSFLYQIAKARLSDAQNALLPYIVRSYPFTTDFSNLEWKIKVYESNVRNLCAVCVARGIIPVLIPWHYPDKRLGRPYGHTLTESQMSEFRALLQANRQALINVSREFDRAVFLDLGAFDDEHFRLPDWIHWNRAGLIEMGTRAASALAPYVSNVLTGV